MGNRNDLATAKANSRVRYLWVNGNGTEMIVGFFLASDGVYDQTGRAGSHPNYTVRKKKECYDNGRALGAFGCVLTRGEGRLQRETSNSSDKIVNDNI